MGILKTWETKTTETASTQTLGKLEMEGLEICNGNAIPSIYWNREPASWLNPQTKNRRVLLAALYKADLDNFWIYETVSLNLWTL